MTTEKKALPERTPPPSAQDKAASTESPKDNGGVKLQKELGLLEGVAMIVGIVIGSGIFVSPKGVILYAGSVGMSLAVWAACGLVAMIGALCFAELGTMIPESGGMYCYLHEAFGAVPAFLYMWVTTVIRNSAGAAIVALTFANYLLQPLFPDCEAVSDAATRLIAAALICFLSWINCVNVRWVAKVQNVFMVTKLLALVMIIVAGLYHLASGHVENFRAPLEGTKWQAAAIATAFYQSLFSYSGWENLYYVVEELKNPNKNLPLAIIISTGLVTAVYTLTNVAYLAVLTPSEMLAADAVAMTFASRALSMLAWTMPLFVMCSTFGSMNGVVFTQSRLIFVGARKGHFPEAFSLVHAHNLTPVPAVFLNGLLTLAMLVTSDVGLLINYSTFAATLTQFACICALFWFRYKQPERTRPFKVWLALPVVFWLVSLFLLVMPILERPVEVGASIGVICTGLPVYYVTVHRQDIARKFEGALAKLTYVCQLLFLGLAEEKAD
ncbi:Y+L amino acid transporter 2-like [Penaeus chinensis]|uniref:Y+L amino acid transporter 2-like n=1 Tax=Penaeus chinensis TaxID=139456 RepID=UPI001FB6C3DB|nr:Y+L amino acid transporter 2-like [Penaeus chinensis]